MEKIIHVVVNSVAATIAYQFILLMCGHVLIILGTLGVGDSFGKQLPTDQAHSGIVADNDTAVVPYYGHTSSSSYSSKLMTCPLQHFVLFRLVQWLSPNLGKVHRVYVYDKEQHIECAIIKIYLQ